MGERRGKYASGRKPAKVFADLYPGWPDLDVNTIDDGIDRRFLRFVHQFQSVYQARLDSGETMSINDFALQLEMPYSLIRGLLRGEKFPSLETVLKLEDKLRVTLLAAEYP